MQFRRNSGYIFILADTGGGAAALCTTAFRQHQNGVFGTPCAVGVNAGLSSALCGLLTGYFAYLFRMSTIALELSRELPRQTDRSMADLTQQRALDEFLRAIERRALRMTELATASRDEALDLVQDAMFGFVRHYADKPQADWSPLFYRVLDNRINDWYRRRQVRNRWIAPSVSAAEDDDDPVVQAPDSAEPGPLLRLAGSQAGQALDRALRALPHRQRQAFLLRLWEGLDVAATAVAMRCSQGSVKTHLSRALTALRRALGEHL